MSKRGGKKGKRLLMKGRRFPTTPFRGYRASGLTCPAPHLLKLWQSNPPSLLPRPDFPNTLVVRMEKKGRRGKTVTRISGVPAGELAALCKEMKKALGCGATVEDSDLILLGDLVPRAVAWFEKAGATKIVRGT